MKSFLLFLLVVGVYVIIYLIVRKALIRKYLTDYAKASSVKDEKAPSAEQIFLNYISEVYKKVTILEEDIPGFDDKKEIQRKADSNKLTYREQLVNSVIDYITYDTRPFGNINGVAIPEEVYVPYRSSASDSTDEALAKSVNLLKVKWL